MESKKIIYVDVDGTICDNPELPNFTDQSMDYDKAEPHFARIDAINDNYERFEKFRVPEDWIFEEYPFLFDK